MILSSVEDGEEGGCCGWTALLFFGGRDRIAVDASGACPRRSGARRSSVDSGVELSA